MLPMETRVPPHTLLQCLGMVGICQGYFCEDSPLELLGKYLLTGWLMAGLLRGISGEQLSSNEF